MTPNICKWNSLEIKCKTLKESFSYPVGWLCSSENFVSDTQV